MMTKIHLLIAGLLLITSRAFAQGIEFDKDNFKNDKEGLKEAKNNLKEGDDFYEQGEIYFKEAIPFYEKANKFNPDNALLNYKLGECYLSSVYKSKAMAHLLKAHKLQPSINPKINFYLGQAYHLNLEFDQAITWYSKYQSTVMQNPDPYYRDNLQLRIQQCYNGKKIIEKPIRVFIDNLGEAVNSKYNEYGAVISADESVIIYTSRRAGSTGGKIDPMLNEHFEDLYISTKNEDGTWAPAENMGENVNTNDHDAVAAISADGQRIIIYKGKSGFGDLFECVLEGSEWSKAEDLGKNINTKNTHEPSACYSPDGNVIYFVSDKGGGIGDHDIYMSRRDEKGKWGPAQNLGATINTKYKEDGVYMHPDGKTLYFGSEGHTSMGGMDIFKSVLDVTNNTWSEPENLGYPVNTADQDAFFVISASGKHGYYMSSAQKDNKGLRDLYMITFLGPEKQMVLNNEDNLLASVAAPIKDVVIAPKVMVKEAQLTILKGVISDYLTKDLLEAEIEIVDNEADKVIATFKSNSKTGRFLVSLPAGKNYGIAVKKDEYLFHSENFDIPNTSAFQEVEKNIELKKLSVGSKIVLRNIFFDLDKATLRPESTTELKRLVGLMTDVPTLKIELGGHTDSQGSDPHNQDLSERRAKAVVDYLTKAGISADRLKSAGYGETQLVNGCTNGVKCSGAQHQENRRTEFKVLAF
ncbi:MAG: outer membrane protein OmpA-like peptidoglycan-associated protein [Crocinitomicaceae bacterium]|jgi:outer membrane protein OmpA-like peptidoglycan-associated protein